jgi:hypothetical protein
MARLILVAQLPVAMRYQEWWPREWRRYFSEERGWETILLGFPKEVVTADRTDFSPVEEAVAFEMEQIKHYLSISIQESDVLLLCDISFPGLFSSALFLKPHENSYAICHATSKNAYDCFAPVRWKGKWATESAHAKLFKKIFVATKYHKDKLGWPNTVVVPFPPSTQPPVYTRPSEKKRNVISVTRDGKQKKTKSLETNFTEITGHTIHQEFFTKWYDYYQYLSGSRVLIITSKEETYGYQIVDAVLCGCVPVAPNKYSYPELLPKQYLYENEQEMIDIVKDVLSEKLPVPILKTGEKAQEFFIIVESYMNKK